MIPKDQKALFLDSKQGKFIVANHVVPRPSTGEILIKVKASGLNPVDWKIQKYGILVQSYPIVLGVNIAGDVVEVGEGVSRFTPGDRVCVPEYSVVLVRH
jgi:NADPH:quinone reductase-like Zn-dependent oxidoreductase